MHLHINLPNVPVFLTLFCDWIDFNECEFKDVCKDGTCSNTDGSYKYACPKGTHGDRKTEICIEKFPYPARVAMGKYYFPLQKLRNKEPPE